MSPLFLAWIPGARFLQGGPFQRLDVTSRSVTPSASTSSTHDDDADDDALFLVGGVLVLACLSQPVQLGILSTHRPWWCSYAWFVGVVGAVRTARLYGPALCPPTPKPMLVMPCLIAHATFDSPFLRLPTPATHTTTPINTLRASTTTLSPLSVDSPHSRPPPPQPNPTQITQVFNRPPSQNTSTHPPSSK